MYDPTISEVNGQWKLSSQIFGVEQTPKTGPKCRRFQKSSRMPVLWGLVWWSILLLFVRNMKDICTYRKTDISHSCKPHFSIRLCQFHLQRMPKQPLPIISWNNGNLFYVNHQRSLATYFFTIWAIMPTPHLKGSLPITSMKVEIFAPIGGLWVPKHRSFWQSQFDFGALGFSCKKIIRTHGICRKEGWRFEMFRLLRKVCTIRTIDSCSTWRFELFLDWMKLDS